MRGGIPLTSPARTIVDLAGGVDSEVLEAVIEDVLHRGLTTPGAIERCLGSAGGHGRTGTARLRRLLRDRDQTPLESRLEVKVWRLLRQAGVRPVRQHEVVIDGQRFRLDFAWPRLQVAVEGDGYQSHAGKAAFVRDRRKWAALAAAGWRIIFATWDDCVHAPGVFLERVRAALVRAATS
jgi:very-short-patch-repair endonuclease